MPDWAREVRGRLTSLSLSPTKEAEIVDELSQHLADRYGELLDGGMPPEEATRLTLKEFRSGDALARYLAPLRLAHPPVALTPGTPPARALSDLWLDVRYAIRQARQRPGFTAVLVVTLAVCLAANVATFAVVDAVVLRPLPFPEPDRLVAIYNTYPGAGLDIGPSSAVDYFDRRQLTALAGLATYRRDGMIVGHDGSDAERVRGMITSPSLFALIGTQALRGRLLIDDDTEPGATAKVLLTYGYWQRVFAGRDAAVGETLRVNGVPFTVVGILPAGWRFIDPGVDIVIPTAFTAQERSPAWRYNQNNWLQVGRLATGATLESLQAQIDALNAVNLEAAPALREALVNIGFSTGVVPFQRFVAGEAARRLYFLWGGAIVVLLVGGVNLANMALVRATTRRREWATRLALGASARRLLRQSLVESWLLSAAGATAGLLLSVWAVTLAPSLGLDALPRGTEIAIDPRALVYLVAAALLVGTALGLLPIVAQRTARVARVIREEGRTGTASRAGRTSRRALAAAQVACALMLLLAGGVLLTSLQRVLAVDIGFRTERLLTAQMNPPPTRYPGVVELRALVDSVLTRVRQLPGVEAAGIASSTPFGQAAGQNIVLAEGYQMAPGESVLSVHLVSVSDGYFETIGARLLTGRWFDAGDIDGRRRVIIIDERLARKFFPDGNAIGRRMWTTRGTDRVFQPPPDAQMLTVAGVVAEMRLTDVVDDPGVRSNGVLYYPNGQRPARAMGLAIRSAGEPSLVVGAVRRAVARLDPELPLYNVETVDNLIDRSLVDRRTPTLLAAGFALVALLLAALGVYGVLAYQVSQRTRELGIRMALGADAATIFRLVCFEGVGIVGAGALAGMAGAFMLRRTIESQLYGTSAMDAGVLTAVASVLAIVAVLVVTIPAHRAARTDPTVALTDV